MHQPEWSFILFPSSLLCVCIVLAPFFFLFLFSFCLPLVQSRKLHTSWRTQRKQVGEQQEKIQRPRLWRGCFFLRCLHLCAVFLKTKLCRHQQSVCYINHDTLFSGLPSLTYTDVWHKRSYTFQFVWKLCLCHGRNVRAWVPLPVWIGQ